MQTLFRYKGYVLSFVIFMAFFAYAGLPVAGLFCWGHFVFFVMPKSWR